MSAQSGDDATRVGVDEREKAVHAAHDEPAARTERRCVGRHGRWYGRRPADGKAAASQGREVDEAYGAPVLQGGERAAVAADGCGREPVTTSRSGLERPTQPPVPREIPRDHAAVQACGIERVRVLVDCRREYAAGVAPERFGRPGGADVPDDRVRVVARGQEEAAIGREDRALHGAGMTSRGRPSLAGP
jgi:hypothetical protein